MKEDGPIKAKLARGIHEAPLTRTEKKWLLRKIDRLTQRIENDVKELDPIVIARLRRALDRRTEAHEKIQHGIDRMHRFSNIAMTLGLSGVVSVIATYAEHDPDQSLFDRLTGGASGVAIASVLFGWLVSHGIISTLDELERWLADRRTLDRIADALETEDD